MAAFNQSNETNFKKWGLRMDAVGFLTSISLTGLRESNFIENIFQ
jgi:hypothetical protein